MTSWLARLGGKSSSEEEEPATVAHMGEANKMYYDEKRKRWVERGKEDEIEEEEELKPPPLAFTKREAPADSAPATGGTDFMAQLTRPVALGSARSRYVDPFASMGAASSSSSEPPASKEPPKLLPPPNPFGGLLPGPPTLAEEGNDDEESTSPKIHKVEPEEDTSKVHEETAPQAPAAAEPSMPPVQAKVESPPLPPQDSETIQRPPKDESLEEEPDRSDGGDDDVWEAPAWGQEITPPAAVVEEEAELDFDDILGGNAWEPENKIMASSPQLREREAEVPSSPERFSNDKATASSPLKAASGGGREEQLGWGALLSNDEWAEHESGWTVVAEDKGNEGQEEEEKQTNDRAPGAAASSSPMASEVGKEEGKEEEGAPSSPTLEASGKYRQEKEDTTPRQPSMVAADEEKEEEEEEVVAEPTSVEVDNQPRNGGDVKEKEKAVEESEASEGEEEKSSSDVIDSPPTSSVVSDNSGVEESGEDKEGIDEEVKRTTSVDFFDQILGEVDEKPASEPKQEEEDMTPKRGRTGRGGWRKVRLTDIPEAPPMMLRTPSPPTIPAPTLPLMLPKTPESSEEGNKEGAAEAAAVVTDGGYSSDGGHASSTPRAAESASIAPTKAPWRVKSSDNKRTRQRSVSDVLLPPSATGSNSPDTGSRGDLSSSRPPPSPVHSTRDSFDRTYRARIADHSKRIQYIEEKMCDHGNAFEEFIKKNSDMMMEMKDNIKELRDEVDGQQKSVNEELRGKIEEQRKQLVEVNEAKEKQEEVLNELRKQVAELSSTVAAAKMANEVDDDTLMKDLPDFIRTRDREDILAFVQNLLKAKKKQEAMYQSRMETGSVYSQRSRSVMQTRNAGGRGQQGGDSSSPASSISRIRRAGSSTNKWQSKRGNRSFMSGPSRSYPVRSFHRLMEEYDSDDDDAGRDDLICSPEGGADTAAASPTSDMDDSHLSEIHSSSALIARLDYLGNQCQYSVPSSTGREETEAARTTLEDGATSTDPAVASAFAKTMEVISFSWDSSALPRNPLLTKSTLFKAFSYMPAKLEELLKGSTRSPLSSGMQRQVRAMLGAMWNITLNEDSSENPILIQGSELLPSLVQVLARYSVDDRDICKNACGLLLTLMTNDSKLCRDFLAIDGGLSVLTSVLRTHKFEQEDAATEQALQCIFLLATVVPECRPTIASQIDRFTLDRLQGIRHASRLRDILYRSSSSSNSKSKFLAPPVPPRHQ